MGRFQRIAAVGLTLACVFFVQLRWTAADDSDQQKPCELDRVVHVKLSYLLYLPKDYEAKESVPLMLFLHGAGERGDDVQKVKKWGVPMQIEAGRAFPCIVVSPQCPKDGSWQPFELTALLDEIVEKYKVDQDRIYVTGLSMGGFGTWAMAATSPKRFAAIVPICGGGDPQSAKRIVHIPTWVFHGAQDKTVPLERSEIMVEALKKNGGNVRFTVYPEVGHESWTPAYDTPELYDWLFQQKRAPKDKGAESSK